MEGGGRCRRGTEGEKRGRNSSPATRGLEKGKLSLTKEGRSGSTEDSWRRLHGTNMWKSKKPLKKDDDVLMVKMKHNKKTIQGIKNHPDQLKVQFDYKQNGNQIPNLRYVNI